MISKKILILVLVVVILAFAWYWYYGQKYQTPSVSTGETQKQKLLRESTTAPAGENFQIPKEIINKITAPSNGKPVSSDVIKSLTAPAE